MVSESNGYAWEWPANKSYSCSTGKFVLHPVVGLESDLRAKTSVITKVYLYLRHLVEV